MSSNIFFSDLFKHKIIFISGKGGVGKSTVCALLARFFQQKNMRPCIVDFMPSNQHLNLLFGSETAANSHFYEYSQDNIDYKYLATEKNISEYIKTHFKIGFMSQPILSNKVIKSFLDSIPGLPEISYLGRLVWLAKNSAKDQIFLVDGFSSGHFHSLIHTPKALLSANITGFIVPQIQRVFDFLKDPHLTTVLYVYNPENLVIKETLEFVKKIKDELPINLTSLVVNRYWHEGSTIESFPKTQEYIQNKAKESKEFYLKMCENFDDLNHSIVYEVDQNQYPIIDGTSLAKYLSL